MEFCERSRTYCELSSTMNHCWVLISFPLPTLIKIEVDNYTKIEIRQDKCVCPKWEISLEYFTYLTAPLNSDLPRFLSRLKLITPQWVREALAEFMGTFILLVRNTI